MQQTWLKREGAQDLILYMLGWAATPNAVCHIDPPGCDVLACYDYDAITPLDPADFAGYRRIYLFAWSYGVWVSEQCCCGLPLHKAVALNGTPFPVDPRYGMRLRIVLRTMRGLAKAGGVNPFAAQGQGGGRYIPDGPFPDRSAEEKVAELERLSEWSTRDSSTRLKWTKAYIATKDEIFPPANMRAYWNPLGLGTEFESFHYPFTNPDIVLQELDT